jgi:hypothetical protein
LCSRSFVALRASEDTSSVERLVTVASDGDVASNHVVASRKYRVLELQLGWLCITTLGVQVSAVSSKELLDALGSATGNVGDLGSRRSRQGQER